MDRELSRHCPGPLARESDGTLRAWLITGDGYLDTGGYMDKHGGAHVQQWSSTDQGATWALTQHVTSEKRFPGWRFNNVQPVTNRYGATEPGMLLFYGWQDPNAAAGRAFLVHDRTTTVSR